MLVRGLFGLLFGALSLLRRLDKAWILVRRAAGHDQRGGVLGRVFAITAVVCAAVFLLWLPDPPRTGHEPRLQGRRSVSGAVRRRTRAVLPGARARTGRP